MKPANPLHVLPFLLCGLAVLSCNDDTPVAPREDGFYMISRKSTYAVGDEIQILLINQTDETKLFYSCGNAALHLYRRVPDGWVDLGGFCATQPEPIRLPARGSLRVSPGVNVGFPAGEYRVGDDICDERREACEWVYSESFLMSGESGPMPTRTRPR